MTYLFCTLYLILESDISRFSPDIYCLHSAVLLSSAYASKSKQGALEESEQVVLKSRMNTEVIEDHKDRKRMTLVFILDTVNTHNNSFSLTKMSII